MVEALLVLFQVLQRCLLLLISCADPRRQEEDEARPQGVSRHGRVRLAKKEQGEAMWMQGWRICYCSILVESDRDPGARSSRSRRGIGNVQA